MNNFKEISKLIKKYKEKNNALYKILDQKEQDEYFKFLISLSELKEEKTSLLAILRRLVDLKEENLIQEWKKNHFKEDKIIQ
ncbi:invasion protein CiaB [Campylobacter hepaticus]